MEFKSTKIVATIGPASDSEETLGAMMRAGMNIMRLNMSHGTHEEHRARIERGRAVADKLGVPIGILLDLSGPKIRTGVYETDLITLKEGERVTLTTEEIVGNAQRMYINYAKLPKEVSPGTAIMLDDGRKRLVVDAIEGNDVRCTVVVGGELKPRRGVNIPGAHLSIETITEKDKTDLAFGLEAGVDIVSLSFVRRTDDIRTLRAMLKAAGKEHLPIVAKIETSEAIEDLEAILKEADGAMVARGDLAVEIPAEEVPRRQKEIIAKANALGKPVITATQMLESMIHAPQATRAEISDVANAVFDGTDAVMLSEETTLGEYPVEAVATLARVARACETARTEAAVLSIPDAVTFAVARAAKDLGASAIVALTETGTTARLVARARPACPIVALTPNEATRRTLALSRGVHPFTQAMPASLEEDLAFIPAFLAQHGFAKKGDTVVVTAGLRFGVSGSTNLMVAITMP